MLSMSCSDTRKSVSQNDSMASHRKAKKTDVIELCLLLVKAIRARSYEKMKICTTK